MRDAIHALCHHPAIQPLLEGWTRDTDKLLRETLAIQAIPAPTFEEQRRAAYVERRMQESGLSDVGQDEVGNVYGRTPGAQRASPALLVSAHLDTVFPAATDLSLRRANGEGMVSGPGVGDNSLGIAAMLSLAASFTTLDQRDSDIWWVGTVGEEGLGDLRGIRQACRQLDGRIGIALIIEGMGLGRIYHAGLGVRRLQIAVRGPGGHSWLHATRPSAIHHLMQIGAALVEGVHLSEQPRTSFNIGLVSGGTSVNTRAAHARMSLDLRADDASALRGLEARVRQLVADCRAEPDLNVEIAVIGDRPSATLSVNHPLVRSAQAVLEYLDFSPIQIEIGSTDANIPLALGIPAICVGITSGGDAHSTDEFIQTEPIPTGMRQITLLALLASAHTDTWSDWNTT